MGMISDQQCFLWCGLTGLIVTGCSAGSAAEAVRPEVPTAAAALDEAECRTVEQGGQPLIVDWKPDQRGELEIAMKDGVAIVSYSCQGITLLPDCRLDGEYGFIGMTRREQVVRLTSADELRANLPLSGVQLSSELQRGASLDIAMLTVGKQRTTWSTPTKADLKGQCDGATHFVRGALVGAFAMSSGSVAKLRAAAEIFGAGTEGASESARHTQNRDGDVADCQKAAPDSERAPPQCGAPIRLVLAPLAVAAAEAPTAETASERNECPRGLVFSDGKCTSKATAPAYECTPGDVDDCKLQCERGNLPSCGQIGEHLAARGEAAVAVEPLNKACQGGHARSCTTLGKLIADGKGSATNGASAGELFEKSCAAADPAGCRELGRAYLAGQPPIVKDENRAAMLLRQACEGGDHHGCALSASLTEEGKGGPRDAARAGQLYKRACDGGLGDACAGAGRVFASGVTKNEILAQIAYQRGCLLRSAAACTGLGRLQFVRSADQAKLAFTQACNLRDPVACAALKALFGGAHPVAPSIELGTRLGASCRTGMGSDCTALALLDLARGQTVSAKLNLQTACTRADAFACAILAKLR
jgi:hypothetical protein